MYNKHPTVKKMRKLQMLFICIALGMLLLANNAGFINYLGLENLKYYVMTIMFVIGTSCGIFISMLILKKNIYDSSKNQNKLET